MIGASDYVIVSTQISPLRENPEIVISVHYLCTQHLNSKSRAAVPLKSKIKSNFSHRVFPMIALLSFLHCHKISFLLASYLMPLP